MRIALALALVVAGPLAAAAQSSGDSRLSFRDGVVYDDDLVPGEPPNQDYVAPEPQRRDAGPAVQPRRVPVNSPNLIGADGRLVE